MHPLNKEIIDKFNEIIIHCENMSCITRDSGLQKEAIGILESLLDDFASHKQASIGEGNESGANLFLGFECVVKCVSAQLQMWLLLKQENPDEAWSQLVLAQGLALDATRAHEGFSHVETEYKRLLDIEKLIFPPQVFLSAGLVVNSQECSICGSEYDECDHLAGMPYWGEFCCIVAKEFKANHVAIVDNPADKRCRIVNFSVEDGERNRMSWKVEPRKPPPNDSTALSGESSPPQKGMTSSAIIMHTDLIEKRRR